MLSRLICCLLLYFPFKMQAQEMLGLTTSNYAGINVLALNPAGMINSRAYCSIHLLSGGAFFDNNYMYLAQGEYAFGELFNKQFQLVDYGMRPDRLTLYDYYGDAYNDVPKQVYLNARLNGPGLMFSYQRHAFAVSTSFRAGLSLHNVPFHVAKFSYEGVDYPPQQNTRYTTGSFDLAQMSWAELGFSYAYMLLQSDREQLSVGLTAKRLFGFTGIYLLARDIDYMVPDDSTLVVYNIDAEAGISVPLQRDTNRFSTADNFFRGRGWGFDFGIVYQKNSGEKGKAVSKYSPTLCGQSFTPYDYKIGLSLLDFGSLQFTQQTDKWVFNEVSTYWLMVNKTSYKSIAEAAGDLGYRFYSDSAAARADNRFRMFLPAALSLQVDYHIQDNFYVHSLLVQNLRFQLPALRRPMQIAVVPRYESRFFEASLPLSFYDLKYARLGVALRLLYFTVGTDRLGSFLGMKDFTGADAYFSVHINLNKGYCKKKKKVRRCNNAEFQKYLF